MNKYKVQFVQAEKYVVDVLAETEEKAKELAREEWERAYEGGTYHYLMVDDTETTIDMVFDVTNTDNPFNPFNE